MIKENLVLIHSGPALERLQGSFMLSLIASPIAYIFDHINEWYFNNYSYIAFVFVAIIFDHILGTWVHAFVKKDFCMRKNIVGFFTKTVLVIMVGIIVEGMGNILGPENIIKEYFSIMARLMVFIYPAGSALMNCYVITNGNFPPLGFIKKLRKFNENMNLKEFDQNKENEQEN